MRTRAAVMLEPGRPLEVEEVELHDPQAGEALLRIEAAGVCHSDLHWMLGHVGGPLPVVLGHEGCGTVVAVGEGVTSVKPGDRCVLILRPNCGRCDYCTTGRPMLCDGRTNPDGTLFDGTTRIRRLVGRGRAPLRPPLVLRRARRDPGGAAPADRRRHPAGPRRARRLRRDHRASAPS